MENLWPKPEIKYDQEKKSRPALVPPEFRAGMARIMAAGAKKYSPNGWRECPYEDKIRYVDALHRHILEYELGHNSDPETGEHHLLHAACCLAILHGLEISHQMMSPED